MINEIYFFSKYLKINLIYWTLNKKLLISSYFLTLFNIFFKFVYVVKFI
ncbi:hypothetical protein FLAN108750_12790 [Flavobacterium antarcticum]